jgi:hypothetical protein
MTRNADADSAGFDIEASAEQSCNGKKHNRLPYAEIIKSRSKRGSVPYAAAFFSLRPETQPGRPANRPKQAFVDLAGPIPVKFALTRRTTTISRRPRRDCQCEGVRPVSSIEERGCHRTPAPRASSWIRDRAVVKTLSHHSSAEAWLARMIASKCDRAASGAIEFCR